MAANTKKDDLVSWLRDADAMEAATTDNLERPIGRADDYPPLQSRLQRHLEVSRRQREEIERPLGTWRYHLARRRGGVELP